MMSDNVETPPRSPRPARKPPGLGLPPAPGEPKVKSKRARIERQKARAESLNNSPDWFGVPRYDSRITLEDRFESATSVIKKNVGRPGSSFTGFRELRVRYILAILGLWAIRFFIPWVEAWYEFTLHLLVDPSHWAKFESYFAFHNIFVYLGKCLLCFAISVIVDTFDSRYVAFFIFLFILLLYIFTPIAGIAILVLLIARGYDRAYYFEWWHRTIVMMNWAMSIPFIAFPIQFFCIFYQEENMSRLAHYNWTAIFVFIEALNASLAHWFIPPNCPTGYFTLFAVWCVTGVLILFLWIEVVSLLMWARLKKPQFVESTARIDSTAEPGASSKYNEMEESKQGISHLNGQKSTQKTAEPGASRKYNDIEKSKQGISPLKGQKRTQKTDPTAEPSEGSTAEAAREPNQEIKLPREQKMLWFSIMLIPVVFTSVVFEILKCSRPEEDWDKHDSIDATSMLLYGQWLGVLLVISVLFVLRKWTKLHKTRLFSPDVLVLGIPLIINAIALAVIFGRFMVQSALAEGDVILGPIPTDEVSVIEFYNVEFRNRTICVYSEDFAPLKVPPRQRATSVLRDPGAAQIIFSVSLDPRTNPPVRTYGSFTYKKGVWVTYVVTLPSSQLGSTDIEAFYSELQLIRINDTDGIRPKKEPTIVFINTYVVNIDGWYFNVSANGATDVLIANKRGTAMIRNYSPGEYTITYWTEFIAFVESGQAPPVTIQLPIERHCVYTVLLCLSSTMKDPSNLTEYVPRMLQTHKTMEIAGPNSSRFPAKEELDNDWAIILGMTLAAMAKSGVYIGYLYLFWIDFPLTGYRTTSMAVFWILNAVPAELASHKVVDIGVKEVTALFVLQILFIISHFGAAISLYAPKFNFRARSD